MNKNEINENDLKVIKKIDIVRERIIKKAQKHLLKNRMKKISLFFVLFLITISIIIVLQNKFKDAEKPTDYNFSIPDNKISQNINDRTNKPVNINLTENTEIRKKELDNEPEILEKTENILEADVNEPETIKPKQTEKTDTLLENDLKIIKCKACTEVLSRKCINEQYKFSIKDTPAPVIWMIAKTDNLPQTVKHVYYHNGNIYCEVPLAIKYPRMRTWSYVTMKNPSHLGSWKVQIVNDQGQILKEINFIMIP